MELNDIEIMQMKKIICRMGQVLTFAFADKSQIFIGFYALLTAQMIIQQYFDEECSDIEEFKTVQKSLLKNESDFIQSLYKLEFKGGENVGH